MMMMMMMMMMMPRPSQPPIARATKKMKDERRKEEGEGEGEGKPWTKRGLLAEMVVLLPITAGWPSKGLMRHFSGRLFSQWPINLWKKCLKRMRRKSKGVVAFAYLNPFEGRPRVRVLRVYKNCR